MHITTVKSFIVDIGHGLNGNKNLNTTNVYALEENK
jgi:hypothetical protein